MIEKWKDKAYWESIPKQKHLRFDLDKEKITGDCWRCAIAAILGLPAEDVPHFVQESLNGQYSRDPDELTQKWLNEHGYTLIQILHNNAYLFPGWWAPEGPSLATQIPVIECGTTRRTKEPGQHHAVVTYNGQLVYDPHPDNCGLTYTTKRYLIVKIW